MADCSAAIQVEDVGAHETSGVRAELLTEHEFRELYRVHGRAVWACLYRLTGNAADADDLVQDTFCRLLGTPIATRDGDQLRAYLFRIASNLAIDRWRQGQRRGQPSTRPVAPGEGTGDALDSRRDPETELALRQDVARSLRELKPQDRVMVWLAYVEGSAHSEIARALGLKPSSVPVLLCRAKKKLAGLLRKKGLGPGER